MCCRPFYPTQIHSGAGGLFITIPWILYQIWAFIAPGLYQRRNDPALPVLISSTLLFYCGMAFAPTS